MRLPEYSDEADFYITCEGDVRYQEEVGYARHLMNGYRKDWVVMQFTGLTDKNGKDIYEGDVCTMVFSPSEVEINPLAALTYEIRFDNASFGFVPTHPDLHVEEDWAWTPFYRSDDGECWDLDNFEVIGNIYENPELLEEQ